jgi:hypothetical protein
MRAMGTDHNHPVIEQGVHYYILPDCELVDHLRSGFVIEAIEPTDDICDNEFHLSFNTAGEHLHPEALIQLLSAYNHAIDRLGADFNSFHATL